MIASHMQEKERLVVTLLFKTILKFCLSCTITSRLEVLKKFPEFAPKQNRSDTKSIEELLREQEILKEALKKAQNRSRRLANENQHIKQEYKELNESHQKLLGAYQKLTEDKLIRL